MQKPKLLGDKVQYGATVAGETIKYGAVGYVIKLLHDVKDSIGYNLHEATGNIVNTLEEKVTDPIIENTGPIGKGMYEAEKWHGRFWRKVFGQTENKQAERREEYLGEKSNCQEKPIQEPPIQTDQNSLSEMVIGKIARFGVKLDEKAGKPIVKYIDNVGNDIIGYEKPEENTQAIVSQPSQPPIQPYNQDHNYVGAGNLILAASILIGATLGHFKARKEYQKAKQNKGGNKK